jgi:hypothetical protein
MLLYTPSYSAERDAVYSEVILQKGMLYPANLPQSMGMPSEEECSKLQIISKAMTQYTA